MLLQVLQNGEIEFPITVEELQNRFPHTSFIEPIEYSGLPEGYYALRTPGPPPEDILPRGEKWSLTFPEWDGNQWVQTWARTPLTDEEIEAEKLKKRIERNRLLAQTDWTQLPDVPEEFTIKSREYRQKLRDIPQDPLFPFVDFPEF